MLQACQQGNSTLALTVRVAPSQARVPILAMVGVAQQLSFFQVHPLSFRQLTHQVSLATVHSDQLEPIEKDLRRCDDPNVSVAWKQGLASVMVLYAISKRRLPNTIFRVAGSRIDNTALADAVFPISRASRPALGMDLHELLGLFR